MARFIGRSMLAIFGVVGMASPLNAATLSGNFTLPTKYEDGSALPVANIANITVEIGTCVGTAAPYTFGTKEGQAVVLPPTTAYSVTVARAFGLFCAQAKTVTTAGTQSVYTSAVYVTKPEPLPNPPVLAVPVIAGMLQTPVYSVAANGSMSTFVGFVDVGKSCSGPVLFTYRAKSFRAVARADVKLWGSTTLRLAAPCG